MNNSSSGMNIPPSKTAREVVARPREVDLGEYIPTHLESSRLGLFHLFLTLWAGPQHGVPQLVVRDASGSWLWRGGPWDGYSFSGVGSNQFLYEEFLLAFNSTQEEIYFYFNTLGDAISRLTMDQNGSGMIYEWKASSQKWDLNWYPPDDTCDLFPACGSNAVCDIGSSPRCRCLDGFYPRNPVSWGRGDWYDGCVRVATLGCGANGTDEFIVVRASKLPDTRKAVADMRLGLHECRTRCLMNCSCTAYARRKYYVR